jgi:phospholipid/cholesterol/gamma-HCH transport system substrate-binding protein
MSAVTSGLRRRQRAELIKLGIFLTVAAVLAVYLLVFTAGVRPGAHSDYQALFTNVSGLEKGDQVRIAGVQVGRVRSIAVQSDASVLVGFDVDQGVTLNASTRVVVRYKNLIGDRVLELTRPVANAARLAPGARIPSSRTASAVDLDTLLNGFKPLFAGLNPGQVNALSAQLVGVLQGQTGAVRTLVTSVGSFTSTIADREDLITGVIGNLNTVLGTFDADREGLGELVTELAGLTQGLARQDDQVLDAAHRIDGFALRASGLIREARGNLTPDLTSLAATARGINGSTETLQTVLDRLPGHYRRILDTASYGNFFNFFLCGVRLQLTDGARPVQSPWIVSDVARCHR